MSNIPTVSIQELLDAGVHFGHKTSRWNPKMAPYIYGARDDVHIIDLTQTVALFPIALQEIYEVSKKNGKILFVSTKIQAGEIIAEYIQNCDQYYINHRWLGGMLTNWQTISNSIKTLDELDKILEDPEISASYTKKELLDKSRRREKLLKSLGGIRNIGGKPDLMVVIDTNKEHLAIAEAKKLGIPIVAILDSNCDPDGIDYPVPGNDDAIRSIKLYCNLFSKAVLAGIKDGLTESGVDIGALAHHEDDAVNNHGITKLKQTNKISKASLAAIDHNSERTQEFEQTLSTKHNKAQD